MKKIKNNLSSVVAIIVVLSLAIGSVVYSYSGNSGQVCEAGAICNYNEAKVREENMGALASPFIYTPLYAFAGLTVENGLTLSDTNLTISDISDTGSDMLILTIASSSTSVEDGMSGDILIKHDDETGTATSTFEWKYVLDDSASTSIETSIQLWQKLDNAYTLSNVFEIDSGDAIFNTDDLFVDYSADRVGIQTATPGYTLDVNGSVNFGNMTYGATSLASSTANATETMPISYLTTYSSLDYTPGDLAVTLTLPATSTMTAFIPNAGDCADFRFRNLDATAATSTTIAAGTGIDLMENENGDVIIEGGNGAQIKFCRELDTDVTVYVDEYIAAD